MEKGEYYLGFDEHFFIGQNKEAAAQQYRELLKNNQFRINDGIREISHASNIFCRKLRELTRDEYLHTNMLRRNGSILKISIDDLASTANLSLVGSQRDFVAHEGRVWSHLVRLLFPEKYADFSNQRYKISKIPRYDNCASFAKEVIRYAANLPIETPSWLLKDEDKTFKNVIGSESNAAFKFWTLAPYIHLELQEKGRTPDESMRRIVSWATKENEKVLPAQFFLDGVGIAENRTWSEENRLGYDERMPSHLLARLAAEIVVGKIRSV